VRLQARHDARREIALTGQHANRSRDRAGAHARAGRFRDGQVVMFWHTGGQVGLFA